MGLKAVNTLIEMDFRVVGNWYDAGKAASLAQSMFDGGVDIILVIAGGAAQGVLKTARDRGHYVLWFDSNGYSEAPGTVVGSSAIKLDQITYEVLQEAIRKRLSYGTARKLGIQDGYVEFIIDDDNFRDSVPPALQEKMKELMTLFQSGSIRFDMPDF
jgi:simple sugar transport system substrate-binding protein